MARMARKKKFARRPVTTRLSDAVERFVRLVEKAHRSGVEVPKPMIDGLMKFRADVAALPADFSFARKTESTEFAVGEQVVAKPEVVSLYGKGAAGKGEIAAIDWRKAGRGKKAMLRVEFDSGDTVIAPAADFERAA